MFKYSTTQWIYGNESLEDSLKRLKKYGYQGVELAGEPYTIDIEETKELLKKFHIADNTREAAGLGQTNFAPVISLLKELGYKGYITMAFLPAVSNPYVASGLQGESNIFDEFTKQSIEHMLEIVETIM